MWDLQLIKLFLMLRLVFLLNVNREIITLRFPLIFELENIKTLYDGRLGFYNDERRSNLR